MTRGWTKQFADSLAIAKSTPPESFEDLLNVCGAVRLSILETSPATDPNPMLRLSVAQLYQSAIELAPIDSHPAVPDQESLRTQSQMLNAVNDLVTWCKAIKDDPSGDGTLDERAASAKFAHPEWTDQQIADHVKCGRGALFKPHMKAYKAAKAALKARRYDYRHNR